MNRSRLVAAAIILLAGLSTFRNVQAIESISWNYTDQGFWDTVENWECNGYVMLCYLHTRIASYRVKGISYMQQ